MLKSHMSQALLSATKHFKTEVTLLSAVPLDMASQKTNQNNSKRAVIISNHNYISLPVCINLIYMLLDINEIDKILLVIIDWSSIGIKYQ